MARSLIPNITHGSEFDEISDDAKALAELLSFLPWHRMRTFEAKHLRDPTLAKLELRLESACGRKETYFLITERYNGIPRLAAITTDFDEAIEFYQGKKNQLDPKKRGMVTAGMWVTKEYRGAPR